MAEKEEFGGSGITYELFNWITANIPQGKTIIELGAGYVSTKFLSERYKLYSVEDKHQFLNIYNSTYIYAPINISANWYNPSDIKNGLPSEYDCILVDGPTGEGNRYGFCTNIDMFRKDVPIIVDDTWRNAEKVLLIDVANKLNRKYELFDSFGVIYV